MLALVSPSLETAESALQQCKESAILVLKHVIEDTAPSGYLQYTQDGIAFATAYAGVWLYKVRDSTCPGLSDMIVEINGLFKGVVEACEKQSQQPKDIPSYFARLFSHLARNSESIDSPVHRTTNADRMQPQLLVANALFLDINFPMGDYQEMNVMSGLDDWWKNYTYLGSLHGYAQ
ncbi:unnamed protein product [Rhizoctonia solani]|uniref:Uncharacterized protein n=1 Tax=Rhizoctonia solani TaxID=456999 RepID=A0A8H3HTV4_9AGAM|nr:unnamed protein product [Rhizoctonia solani]